MYIARQLVEMMDLTEVDVEIRVLFKVNSLDFKLQTVSLESFSIDFHSNCKLEALGCEIIRNGESFC